MTQCSCPESLTDAKTAASNPTSGGGFDQEAIQIEKRFACGSISVYPPRYVKSPFYPIVGFRCDLSQKRSEFKNPLEKMLAWSKIEVSS